MRDDISNDAIVTAYTKKGCNVSATCSALGISRQTFYVRKNSDAELRERLEEADESIIDFAESKLVESIGEGDLTAIIFFLKTKGKKRGYVEKYENDVSVNSFEKLLQELPDDPNDVK